MTISNRANTLLLVLILATGLAIVAMLASGVRGGPLDPPAAPGSTDGVREPGTPISSLPFNIVTAGRYYLTRDLTLTGATPITINASDVDLDLSGLELGVAGGGGTLDVVQISGTSFARIRIHNGSIISSGLGIHAVASGTTASTDITVEDMRLSTQSDAIELPESDRSIVRRCNVDVSTASDGIAVGPGSIVDGCTVSGSGDAIQGRDNVVVENCTVNGATSSGINITRGEIEHCAVNGANVGITIGNGTASNVTVTGTVGVGIQLNAGGRATDCTVTGSGSSGILNSSALASVERCVVDTPKGDGISVGASSSVRDSIVRNAGGAGIIVGAASVVTGNAVNGSGALIASSGNGIFALPGTAVTNNVVSTSANDGILVSGSGSYLSGNTITGSTLSGIAAAAGGNTFLNNSASGNGIDFSDRGINVTGVLITTVNDATNTIPQTNFTP